MTFKIHILIALIAFCATTVRAEAPLWQQKGDIGWSFYKDPIIELEKKPQSQPKPMPDHQNPVPAKPETYPMTRQLEKVKHDFEESQARAVLHPTLENVQQFQQEHNRVMSRAEDFSKSWMLAALLSPDTYHQDGGTNPRQRQIYQEHQLVKLEHDIKALAKDYGLFFLFKKDCPYCHAFAPVVKEFSQHYQFSVKAISPDGQAIDAFPNVEKDNGALAQLNPEGIYPALFLIHPRQGNIIPLARGMVNIDDLRQNLKIIINYLGEHHAS